jgi:hypothetical protein
VKIIDSVVGSGCCKRALQEINSKERLDMGIENTLEVIGGTMKRR